MKSEKEKLGYAFEKVFYVLVIWPLIFATIHLTNGLVPYLLSIIIISVINVLFVRHVIKKYFK